MHYFIFVLLVSFTLFLFSLYVLCKEDFTLFRKNVDMEKIFNLAFIVAVASLLSSRFFFILFNFKPLYLNPLAFLLFSYFPGLSLPGALLGGSIVLTVLSRKKKYPEGRIFDFFIIAFLIAIFLGYLTTVVITYIVTKQIVVFPLIRAILSFILFFFASNAVKKPSVKEGSVGLISIFLLSICFIISYFFNFQTQLILFVKESTIWVITFFLTLLFLLKQDTAKSFIRFFLGHK